MFEPNNFDHHCRNHNDGWSLIIKQPAGHSQERKHDSINLHQCKWVVRRRLMSRLMILESE